MLKIALIGCGRIAKRHSELLGYQRVRGARLAAVCDIAREKAETIGRRFHVPYYTDMHEMLEEVKEIDAISILTPSGLHCRHVLELVPYKRHLIVEKPLALNSVDADKMISASAKAGIRLFVVKQNRFNLPVQKLRKAMEAKRFGKLVMGTVRLRWCRRQEYYDLDPWRGTKRYDGGVFFNQASHHIDLLSWMMGEVESVYAKATTVLVDIETEDTGIALLKFKSGALGVIEATTAARPIDLEGSISILGEKGAVEISGFAVNEMKTWHFEDESPADKALLKKYSTNPPNVYGFGHQMYYEHALGCIQNKKKTLVDGEEAKKSVDLIEAIYESIRTRKEVKLK